METMSEDGKAGRGRWLAAMPSQDPLLLISVISSYVRYRADGSDHTSRGKRGDLRSFIDWLSARFDISELLITDITHTLMRDWFEDRLLYYAPATVNRHLATLKVFFDTVERVNRIPGFVSPTFGLKPARLPEGTPQSLTPEEWQKVRDFGQSLDPNDVKNFQPYVLLSVLGDMGLRIAEPLQLCLGQVDLTNRRLLTVRRKGRLIVDKPFSADLGELLGKWLQVRSRYLSQCCFPHVQYDPGFPLFVSPRGADVSDPRSFQVCTKTGWRWISDFCKNAGIGHINTHRFRHMFCTQLLDAVKDIRLVAQAADHGDVRTTMRYTVRSEDAVREGIEAKSKTFNK